MPYEGAALGDGQGACNPQSMSTTWGIKSSGSARYEGDIEEQKWQA